MNTTLTIELGSPLFELTPEKPRHFLEKALKRGLTVRVHGNTSVTGALSWTIESGNPIDDWQLWLYFQPSARGGRLTINRYTPGTQKSTSKQLTHQVAGITIDDMGDALDRHHAREAAKREEAAFQARRDAHATDLDTAANPEAATVLGTLKVNGRFALRMARNGAIPRTTTGTVRQALINRGLVSPAGGILTDLGRATRALVLA